MTDTDLRHLPLEDLHRAAGARFGGFAGWSMPLTYPLGVLKEHLHARAAAGLFDISHMKLVAIEGPGADALIARACPVDPSAIAANASKYTFLLNDAAGIIDDLIVTRLSATRWMAVVNAGNAGRDAARFVALAAGLDCTVEPLDRVFLALQGPRAVSALEAAGLAVASMRFMTGTEPRAGWFLTRSGYTGEDGFEIGLPEADARMLVGTLMANADVAWIGLAARDSLRLEAGLPLHGQDITEETDPVAAALLWAIPKSLRAAGTFAGAEALHKAVALGAAQRRVGLKPDGRQPVRAGALLTDATGAEVGRVTSGGFGPSVGHPVAMGYVPASGAAPGTRYFADVRGTKVPLDVHPLPFTPHRTFKG